MAQRRVTSRDVARHAGVSRTTVSFVLNKVDAANISEETRARVLQAARELGYVPDAAARMLASGQSRTIGLIISHAQHIRVDAFIPQVLYGLNEISRQRGFRLLLETVDDVSEPEAYIDLVHSKQIDGLVVLNPRGDDPQLARLFDQGYPLVLIGSHPHPNAAYVNVNQVKASRRITAHLIGLGHTRIGFINYAPAHYIGATERLRGYREALLDAQLPLDESLIRFGDYSAASGYEAMTGLLAAAPRPTAVVAGNDTIALGAIAAIHEAGLRIPEDIAIVGYDDIPNAAYFVPPLTTIHSPARRQAQLSMELLIQLIEGKTPPARQITLDAELVIRHSCGARGEE